MEILSKLASESLVALGFISGVIAIAYFLRQSRQEDRDIRKDMVDVTREVTVALTKTAISNDHLSSVLDKNLISIANLPSKDDVETMAVEMTEHHKMTHSKLDDILLKVK